MRDDDLISISLLIAVREQRYTNLRSLLYAEETVPIHKYDENRVRELEGRNAEVKDELEFLHALQRQMRKGGDGDESAEPVAAS